MSLPELTIITRKSPLAMAQTHLLVAQLKTYANCKIITSTTLGDQNQIAPIHTLGGKGAFVGTLEAALIDRQADIAVHSLKDLGVMMPSALCLAGTSQRAAPHDLLIFAQPNQYRTWADLPQGAIIGTSSLRRTGFALSERPDLNIKNCRGNVATRLEKLGNGEFDAIILAQCGLTRLNQDLSHRSISLPTETWVPAAGAATIGYQCRTSDTLTQQLIKKVSDRPNFIISKIERAFVKALGGQCHWPLAVHAQPLPEDQIALTIAVPHHNSSKPVWRWQGMLSQSTWSSAIPDLFQTIVDIGILDTLNSWPNE